MRSLKSLLKSRRTRNLDRRLIRQSGRFDPAYYLQHNPDIRRAGLDPLQHYLAHGRFEQRAPSSDFDPIFYNTSNPDVRLSGMDPFVHYLLYGQDEHRAAHRPVVAAIKTLAEIIADSGLFDAEFYRTLYLDTTYSEQAPLDHYLSIGRQEQRRPSADFDPAVYLEGRPDVKKAGLEPLMHYIELGRKEGIQKVNNGDGTAEITQSMKLIQLSGLFDRDHYLRQYPAARDASVDPLLHYVIAGSAPFVHPSPAFTDLTLGRRFVAASNLRCNPLLQYLELKAAGVTTPLAIDQTFINEAILYEVKAGDSYLARFRLVRDDGSPHEHEYALDTLADLVCQKPNLVIDRMHPDASIIIPVFGQLPFVLNCIDSLRQHNSHWTVEIIIADDASADSEEITLLQAIPWIRYARRAENGGFIDNCNDAAQRARGRFLVFLNSDTRVVEGWLDELLDSFNLYPKAGLIGSSLCDADGTLQEAGGIYWADGSAWNYGRGDDPSHPKYNFARQVDYVSGCSIAIPTNVWQLMGGFDTTYRPAYCEDADLAFKLRKSGYEVWLQPLSRVIHLEGKSHGRDTGRGVKRYQPINIRKFGERWRDTLADHGEHGHKPDNAASRKVGDRILVLDANTPTPDRDSGSFMTFRIMVMLQDLGYQITFVPESNYSYQFAYTAALQRRGIECLYSPFFHDIEDVLKFRSDFEVVIAFRHSVLGPTYSTLRKRMPSARIVFHNVDLHFWRQEREVALHGVASKRIAAASLRATELELIAKVDCTIVHTSEEAEVIRKHLPVNNIIGFRYVSEVHKSQSAFEDRMDVMFLGGFRHPPNVDAVIQFATTVWPRLAQRLPEAARFLIVGPDAPAEIRQLAGPRIVVTGYVPDLKTYFDQTRVFVAPLRYGAGIKGKVIQSLSYGAPAVVTTIAAEGIGLLSGRHAIVTQDDDAFADAVVLLYSDKTLWYSLQSAGYKFVEEQFSKRSGLKLLSSALDMADSTWLARHNRSLDGRLRTLLAESPAAIQKSSPQDQELWVHAGHYYSPIVDPQDANVASKLKRFGTEELAPHSGIEIHEDKMLQLLRKLSGHYHRLPFTEQQTTSSIYYYDNPFFSYGDAIILGLIMLSSPPRRIIEVGSGFSSAAMIDINDKVLNGRTDMTFIEPFPERLLELLPSDSQYLRCILRQPVQAVPLDKFAELRAGDILFIDSAHVSKMASDVNYLVFEILPILQPGVLVHIHDVFYPFEYPPKWIRQENRSWNEAYLVRAFLQFNPSFEIFFFNDFASRKFPDEIYSRIPLFVKNSGGSLWLRRVDRAGPARLVT